MLNCHIRLESDDYLQDLDSGTYYLYGIAPVLMPNDFIENGCLYGIVTVTSATDNYGSNNIYRAISIIAINANGTKCIMKNGICYGGAIVWA